MTQAVTTGTVIACTMGMAPAALTADPGPATATTTMAVVTDFKPTTNIASFGMCISLANPQVAAATTAAQGVLTPQPCIPATSTPWTPGSPNVTVNAIPCVTSVSTCACAWGGIVSVVAPAQQFVSLI